MKFIKTKSPNGKLAYVQASQIIALSIYKNEQYEFRKDNGDLPYKIDVSIVTGGLYYIDFETEAEAEISLKNLIKELS